MTSEIQAYFGLSHKIRPEEVILFVEERSKLPARVVLEESRAIFDFQLREILDPSGYYRIEATTNLLINQELCGLIVQEDVFPGTAFLSQKEVEEKLIDIEEKRARLLVGLTGRISMV